MARCIVVTNSKNGAVYAWDDKCSVTSHAQPRETSNARKAHTNDGLLIQMTKMPITTQKNAGGPSARNAKCSIHYKGAESDRGTIAELLRHEGMVRACLPQGCHQKRELAHCPGAVVDAIPVQRGLRATGHIAVAGDPWP